MKGGQTASRRGCVFALALCLSTLLQASNPAHTQPAATAAKWVEQGLEAARSQKFDLAIQLLKQALYARHDPKLF